jgi:hypothetical protein
MCRRYIVVTVATLCIKQPNLIARSTQNVLKPLGMARKEQQGTAFEN